MCVQTTLYPWKFSLYFFCFKSFSMILFSPVFSCRFETFRNNSYKFRKIKVTNDSIAYHNMNNSTRIHTFYSLLRSERNSTYSDPELPKVLDLPPNLDFKVRLSSFQSFVKIRTFEPEQILNDLSMISVNRKDKFTRAIEMRYLCSWTNF